MQRFNKVKYIRHTTFRWWCCFTPRPDGCREKLSPLCSLWSPHQLVHVSPSNQPQWWGDRSTCACGPLVLCTVHGSPSLRTQSVPEPAVSAAWFPDTCPATCLRPRVLSGPLIQSGLFLNLRTWCLALDFKISFKQKVFTWTHICSHITKYYFLMSKLWSWTI